MSTILQAIASLACLRVGVASSEDFFSFAPRDFASKIATGASEEDLIGLPGASFFSNFQMPFLSFEEITIHDRNSSSEGSNNRRRHQQVRPGSLAASASYVDDVSAGGDSQEDDADAVISIFGNISAVVGSSSFFDELTRLAEEAEPVFNGTDLQILERSDPTKESTTSRSPQFSVYRITTDGRTPFGQEGSSEIIYDDNGQPEEVVVYLDEHGQMDTSETRPAGLRLAPVGPAGPHGPARQFGPRRRPHPRFRLQQQQQQLRLRRPGMRHAGSQYLPDSGGYYDEEAYGDYDDDRYAISRDDAHVGNLEYVGGGEGYTGSGVGVSGHGDNDYPVRRSGYGHDHVDRSYGHDHHGGYDDHHGGGYHDDHDHGYSPVKKPGPFGYGKPNYKCEYAKETLYVTKTDYKFKKKCYKILKVKCKTKYDVGKKIGYKKVCNEFSITKCRTVYATKFKTKCWLVYKKKCEDIYKTKVDWVYKEKCTTKYDKECHGYGYHKQCHDVPKEICKQVPTKKEKHVKSIKCKKVPDKKCKDVPFFVPKKECKDFPRTVCVQDPINVKKDVPKKVCFTVPIEKCVKVPKEVLKHVPKTVKKKVCVSTKAHDDHHNVHEVHYDDHHGGYGHDDHHGGYDDHKDHGGYGHDDHKDHGGYGHDDHKDHGGYGHDDHKDHGGYGHDDHHGGYHRSDHAGGYDHGGYESSLHYHRSDRPTSTEHRSSAEEAVKEPAPSSVEEATSAGAQEDYRHFFEAAKVKKDAPAASVAPDISSLLVPDAGARQDPAAAGGIVSPASPTSKAMAAAGFPRFGDFEVAGSSFKY